MNWYNILWILFESVVGVYVHNILKPLNEYASLRMRQLWNSENVITFQRRQKSLNVFLILIILCIIYLVYQVFFSSEITRMTIFLIVSTSILTTILMMLYFYLKYVFIPYFSEDGIIDKQIQVLDKLTKIKS
ncbi:MAG: hypothetical protein IPL98_17720 [Saprospiraceae bacterium]|nr:hypothetical protein [Saprospiraceae bacterium]